MYPLSTQQIQAFADAITDWHESQKHLSYNLNAILSTYA